MTKEEIQAQVDALYPWHYNHIFPFGVSTGESQQEAIHPKLAELLRVGAFPRKVYHRVLDLGANSGLISMWFVDNKQSFVVAVEGNERYYDQLELAIKLKDYQTSIRPVFQDITQLNFGEGEYDLILLLGTLHHIEVKHHLDVLKGCRTALLPAGEIVVQTSTALPVADYLLDAGFVIVQELRGTSWHDRKAWSAMKDPMKIWT